MGVSCKSPPKGETVSRWVTSDQEDPLEDVTFETRMMKQPCEDNDDEINS